MKPFLRSLILFVAWAALLRPGAVLAQTTPTLEFATGAGNPTGDGPVNTPQVITFQNNTDNPTGNTFTAFSPTTTATFTLTNQQGNNQSYVPGTAMSFGSTFGTGTATAPFPLFTAMNGISFTNVTTATANSYFSSAPGTTGGIDVATNRAVSLYLSVLPLPQTVPENVRYYYGDLTITFNRPVINPVIQIVGLGGTFTPAGGTRAGFATDLDLSTAGVQLSELNGSPELTVTSTGGSSSLGQIFNNVANPNATTGSGAASGSVLVSTPAAGITSLTFQLFIRPIRTGGQIHNGNQGGDVWLMGLSQLAPSVTGYVFEDVNYGGGAGRTLAASNGVPRPNARVELYNSAGTFVTATTTDANGLYTFSGQAAGNYTVRVVNNTVTSSRGGYTAALIPVQTYNGAGNRVGGEAPAKVDAANGTTGTTLASLNTATTIAESQAIVAVTTGNTTTGPDFGFNFNTVVNTNDVATVSGNNAQGSLRQFIINSNALLGSNLLAQAGFYTNAENLATGSTMAGRAGVALPAGRETSIFMIPAAALTNGVAVINTAAVLPQITGINTHLNAATQTYNIGNTNDRLLGAGGTVGTGATALSQLNGPEVQLKGTRTGTGLELVAGANNAVVRGFSIYGYQQQIGVAADVTNTLIEQNIIGTTATSFTDPGAGVRGTEQGIYLANSDNGTVRNNLIGYNGGMGIWVYGSTNGANNNLITNNELRGNAQEVIVGGTFAAGTTNEGLVFDGIELQGVSTGNTVSGNLITESLGHGIDSFGNEGAGGNTITGNTISNNGVGVATNRGAEGSGIRVYSATATTTISNNVLSGNNGSGVLLVGTANAVNISQNSTFNNTRLAIDILTTTESSTVTNNYNGVLANNGVTINDNGDGDTGGNGAINFPVIQTATIRNGNLIVTGFATQNAVVELFVSDNFTATNSFGEGQTFLASRTEGLAADDADATTGSYAPNVNGLNQGTETNQQRFRFTIPLASLSTAQLSALNTTNAKLTATATLATLTNGNQGTSEFSGTAAALQSPTANNDFATTTANTAAPVTFAVSGNDTPNGTLNLTTLDLDPNTAGIQTSFATAQGTFTTVGVTAGSVRFTPANNTFIGNVTIPYVISNNQGVLSNQANLTVSVTPVLDLITAITAPNNNSSVTAGAPLSYTVTAQNASAIAANSVTQTLQLVPGLLNNGGTVSFTIGGANSSTPTYDNNTGLVNFTPTPVALAANATNTYTANFTKAPATGPITATANIGSTAGSNGPELNRTNNFATNTVNITPSYDVATTITGSVDGAGLPASVVSGGLVTYLVRTTNLAASASPAPNVIQTVTFDGNLLVAADGLPTGLYISNGGTAAYNTTTMKTVVTFPALSTLPIGQTVTNTISFAAPAATYGATANVQANGAANPGDNNPGDTNTGTTSNDRATVSTTVIAGAGTPANVYTTISSNQTVTTPGTPVTLTVVAGNRGAGTAANVVQQVQLPAGLAGVSVTNGTYDSATGIVTFTLIPTLTPQATNPLPFTIQFNAPAAGPVLATATVREANADLVPADNVAEVKVDILNTTDVTTTLAGPATAAVGQAVTYNVTTSNLGPNTAFNVVQTVQLPAGLNANGGVTFGGATAGTYNNTTGVATFTLTSPLGAASRQVNTLTFNVPASVITDPSGATTGSNQLAVLAAVRTSTTEANSTNNATVNNSAATVVTVTPAADVVVAVSGPASALAGSPVTYAVTATNNGPVPVASVVPTLQLPAGLTSNGGTVLLNGAATSAGASYDNATGLVTFATATNLPTGGSVANTVTVQMPDVTQLVPVARAQVGSATIDTNLSNNRADALTTITNTAVVGSADLFATALISGAASATVLPGASVTLNATFGNTTGGITATDVVPRVQLPAGLANGGNAVTVAGGTGGAYNNTTGLVTWTTVPSLASGTTLSGYNVTFVAPASGTLTATSFVASSTTDAVASNNARSATVTVTPQVDVTTSISGPVAALTGSRVTYAVVTANNGPSPSGVVTQTVTIPVGATNISFPAGSTQAAPVGGTITITFPLINAMSVGTAGNVVNYVSFDAPTTSYTVSATANTPGDTNAGNNTLATPFATAVDQAPTAYDVVNTLPSFLTGVIGSTAGPIKISPLLGNDADAGQTATLTYTLTSLPAANTGILYLDAAGTIPAATGVGYTATQIANLYFNPRGTINPGDPTYIGNVTFGYTTTDVPGLISAPALYTIAVGKDERSVATSTPTKGGTDRYQNNDPIVNIIDVNTVNYNTNGSLPFGRFLADRTLNANAANNGIVNVVQTGGTLIPGLALDATTGQIYVQDRTKLVGGSYSITVTTIDANGGTNTLTIPYSIGAFPLPVELSAFTATAKNLDALLAWNTASEKNSDHFDVERSLNGTAFVKIAEVRGQGTSNSATDYAHTDAGIGAKVSGLVYYRLKQVDTDGTSTFSPVRTVRFGQVVPAIALFPNPATTATNLDLTALPAGSYQVSVLDAAGRTVLTTTLQAGLAHALQLNTIASGSYTLLVRGTNAGQVVNLTKRLVKE